LVTQTVKVKSTDLEHGPIYYINNTLFVSFFVHKRNSRDRFRIFIYSLEYNMLILFGPGLA